MLLSEQEIRKILDKDPKKLKNKANGEIINEYTYELHEQLSLIQTYIKEKKRVDIGTINPPKGEVCMSFMQMALGKGIHPMVAMNKSSDIEAANFAFDRAMFYYRNKFKKNE